MIGIDDVRNASRSLDGVARRTPVVRSALLDELVGARLFLKAESLQLTGSFKFRGAYNKIAAIPARDRKRGVLAFSSGNHAQAVALAAKLFSTNATIVMPTDAPAIKLAATRRHGAEVITYDRYSEDREEIGRRIAHERGLTVVAPFDDPLVMAGQGTAALELVEDAGSLHLLLAPVSGGGLVAGGATAMKSLCPGAGVIGVEPASGDDYRQSLNRGDRVAIDVPETIADALQATAPGELTFGINRALLDGIVTVSDAELVEAMRFAFEHLKLVLEPAGAAGLAAMLAGRVPVEPTTRVGVILSGGNVDLARFCALLAGSD